MAGRYLGIAPIKIKDGRILKTGEIYEDMPYNEAIARKGFEPVTVKKEFKKSTKEKNDE